MQALEKGQEKIQKICDQLRRNTLEPAELNSTSIIEEAERRGKDQRRGETLHRAIVETSS